jgi:rhodanese-related sulfurtransferase
MHYSDSRKPRGIWSLDEAHGNHLPSDRVDSWEITPRELQRLLAAGDPLVLVDVREPWESNIVSLPGSRFVPLNELGYRAVEELEPDDEIVLYCHHGHRSMEGVMMLWELGYENVKSLAGGIGRWIAQIDPGLNDY